MTTPFTLSPRIQRLMTIVGYLIILAALISMFERFVILSYNRASDFTYDYLSAQSFLEGGSLYVTITEADLRAPQLSPFEHYNAHPPFSAFMFLPFVSLPYSVAVGLWTWGTVLLYLGLLWVILRELKLSLPRYALPLAIGLSFFWQPFVLHIRDAPFSIILAVCIVGAWLAQRHNRPALSGALIAIATLVKLFPGLLLVYLLLRRKWHALVGAGATLASGMLLSLLVFGLDDMLIYVTDVIWRTTPSTVQGSLINVSLASLLRKLLVGGIYAEPILFSAPQVATFLTAGLSLVALGLYTWAIWRFAPSPRGDDFAFGLTCVAMVVLSPSSWPHAFLLLMVPLGLLVRPQLNRPQFSVRSLGIVAFVAMSLPTVWIGTALVEGFDYMVPGYATTFFLLPNLGLLLLWGIVQWYGAQAAPYEEAAPLADTG